MTTEATNATQTKEVADATTYQRCGAERNGKVCRNPAGKGTDHLGVGTCSLHLGTTANHRAAARAELYRRAAAEFGVPIDTDPVEAILGMIARSAGMVVYYEEQVRALGGQHVGDVLSAAPRIGLYATHEDARAIVKLYNEERDRLVKYAVAAAKLGIEERRVKLAEETGTQVGQAVRDVLSGLKLSPDIVKQATTELSRRMLAFSDVGKN
jgi:hypothetical protein